MVGKVLILSFKVVKKKRLIQQRSLTLAQKQKVIDKWIEKNGCATFDLKDRQIILHDGAGFCIEKEIKYLPRHRRKPITEGPLKGGVRIVKIKGPKVKHEFYSCYYSFEDLDETINHLRRMKKMLNSIGYRTEWMKDIGKGIGYAKHLSMKGGKKK